MNSLKSACSFAKSTPLSFYQFQEHCEPIFRCKLRIELIIRQICIFETMEYLGHAIHGSTLTCVADRSPTHAAENQPVSISPGRGSLA